MLLAILACLTVRVINSRNASEGTWDARWDFSEPEKASTGAADMSASRVEVGDGVPFGSEHAQYLVEIRRLEAEIERLLARDALMMAEIRRLTAENEVPLRERERQMMAEIRKLSAEKEELLRESESDAERQRACRKNA